MEEKIVIDKPVKVAGKTLILINQVSLYFTSARAGMGYFALKRPVAIVVVSPKAREAFQITGEVISLDLLRQKYPDLEDYL